MSILFINKQTEAEKDQFLFDCFHDTGLINELIESSYSIISGRKGAGKTAVARYMEHNPNSFGIDYAYRISIRNFNSLHEKKDKETLDSILFYIITKTVQKLLREEYFLGETKNYWRDFITRNGLQNISDYESFIATKKTKRSGLSLKAIATFGFLKGEAGGNCEQETLNERVAISTAPSALFESLRQSINCKDKMFILIDDITDYLDKSSKSDIKRDIDVIKDLLLQLQTYNLSFIDSNLKIRFISLVRDDIFEFMQGSNINKIKTDSLRLEWSEKDFASLIIKRMIPFKKNLEEALRDPVRTLKDKFPDEIFSEVLNEFKTNRYMTNFYAYMSAISFNRPRDYLQFCYALRNRLSEKDPATFENIESAEIEYCDYFIQELRDELFIVSQIFDYDLTEERINKLVDILSNKERFNSSELKTELSKFIGQKTSVGWKKIEILVSELWRYGILGVTEKQDKIIRFKYLSDAAIFTSNKIKQYTFYLHRGLWWFAKKYRNSK